MQQFLVISAVGRDRPGIVNQLSDAILASGGNIADSRMSVLGGEFALILLVNGEEAAIAALENRLPAMQEQLELTLVSRRTQARAQAGGVPYYVEVVSMDHPGIVRDVAEFFSSRNINIEELSTRTYPAAHTGTPMFALNMTISVPPSLSVSATRKAFIQFCDDLNLDGDLEPVR